MKYKFFLILIPAALILFSCNKEKEYISILEEIRKIECDNLSKFGVSLPDTTTSYSFRAAAFDCIMKNTDRVMLAHYEDLNNKVAHLTYYMDNNEKEEFHKDLEHIYNKSCN